MKPKPGRSPRSVGRTGTDEAKKEEAKEMACPKCGWKQVSSQAKEVYACQTNGEKTIINLWFHKCLRNGCDWKQRDNYLDRVQELRLRPFSEVSEGL